MLEGNVLDGIHSTQSMKEVTLQLHALEFKRSLKRI